MRYTVENTVKQGRQAKVWLDGVEVKECLEADDEVGYVIRAKKDEHGKYVLTSDRNDIEFERLEGQVRVEVTEGG